MDIYKRVTAELQFRRGGRIRGPVNRKDYAASMSLWSKFSLGQYVYIERVDCDSEGYFPDKLARRMVAKIVKVDLPKLPGLIRDATPGNLTLEFPTGEAVDVLKPEYKGSVNWYPSTEFVVAMNGDPNLEHYGYSWYFHIYTFGEDFFIIKELMESIQKEQAVIRERKRVQQRQQEEYRAKQAVEEQERLLREQKLNKEAESQLDALFESI